MSRRTGISSAPMRLSNSLAAGGAAEKAAIIFRNHDVNQVRGVSFSFSVVWCGVYFTVSLFLVIVIFQP